MYCASWAPSAVTAVVAGGVAGWFLRPVPPPEPGPVVRFSVPLPAEQSFTAVAASMIAVSPDGTRIAYVADRQIFLRNVGEREAYSRARDRSRRGVSTAATPAFSPDGQWLAYVQVVAPAAAVFALKRVPDQRRRAGDDSRRGRSAQFSSTD